MLLWLTEWLEQYVSAFNVFSYITFRTLVATGTALFISLLVGPLMIRWLERRQIGDVIRKDGPEGHYAKEGTPTMGGLLILISIIISSLCWVELDNRQVWIVLAVLLSFGFIGFLDDYIKLSKREKWWTFREAQVLSPNSVRFECRDHFVPDRYKSRRNVIVGAVFQGTLDTFGLGICDSHATNDRRDE